MPGRTQRPGARDRRLASDSSLLQISMHRKAWQPHLVAGVGFTVAKLAVTIVELLIIVAAC